MTTCAQRHGWGKKLAEIAQQGEADRRAGISSCSGERLRPTLQQQRILEDGLPCEQRRALSKDSSLEKCHRGWTYLPSPPPASTTSQRPLAQLTPHHMTRCPVIDASHDPLPGDLEKVPPGVHHLTVAIKSEAERDKRERGRVGRTTFFAPLWPLREMGAGRRMADKHSEASVACRWGEAPQRERCASRPARVRRFLFVSDFESVV